MAWRGTWLITGGLGGLGLAVAGWLAERGVARLLLVGRHAPGPAASAELDRLRAAGATVEVRLADVCDRAALAAVVAEAGVALRGVVHTAGVLDDGTLAQLNWPRFAAVLAPKVTGARHLHELTAERELDAFVLFSSAAALLGNAGQANHAAANAWLDALAQHRHARGLPALSINWGAWAEVGAAAGTLGGRGLRGYLPIDRAVGLTALGRAMEAGLARVALAPIAWDRLPAADQLFFSRLRPAAAPTAPEPAAAPPRLDALAPAARLDAIEDMVADLVARILGSDGPVDRGVGLFDAGIDSLMSVELRNRLQQSFGLSLPSTVAFDHPSIAALARHLAGQLAPPAAEALSEDDAAALIEAEFAALQGGAAP